MDLIVKPTEEIVQEKVSLKPKTQAIQVKHEAEKIELSENIKRYDKKVKVHTQNPYAFNTVAAKNRNKVISLSQSANQLITNPTYNSIGKFLGVDTVHDWSRYYDKVYVVTEWARQRVGDDRLKISKWLTEKLNSIPAMASRRIDDLYIAAKLEGERLKK